MASFRSRVEEGGVVAGKQNFTTRVFCVTGVTKRLTHSNKKDDDVGTLRLAATAVKHVTL